MKRILLDLCCGAGLAAAGYWQSGCFSEIVGIDLNPEFKRIYPFDFIQGDAFQLDYDFLAQFDFAHASPPCQYYSSITPKQARSRHPRLIPATHLMLHAAGLPYVIENVPGSGHDLRPNLILSGLDVGLPLHRPRLFHISSAAISQINILGNSNLTHLSPGLISNIRRSANSQINIDENSQINSPAISQMIGDHNSQINIQGNSQIRDRAAPNLRVSHVFNIHGGNVSRAELIQAFGLSNLPISHLRRINTHHIEQGIPPAMTREIARLLFSKLMVA